VAGDDAALSADIEAAALVPAPPEEVFEFLSDLANHWRLADRHVQVVELNGSGDGGTVRIRGPLGTRRTAHTRVTATRSPRLMIGIAELSGGTRARVSWTLAGRVSQTRVRLAADVEQVSPVDRVLLALGGRAYMRRMFRRTLEHLAQRFGQPTPAP
jgi:carbon monoxide dehydrogenase subunit G